MARPALWILLVASLACDLCSNDINANKLALTAFSVKATKELLGLLLGKA